MCLLGRPVVGSDQVDQGELVVAVLAEKRFPGSTGRPLTTSG